MKMNVLGIIYNENQLQKLCNQKYEYVAVQK